MDQRYEDLKRGADINYQQLNGLQERVLLPTFVITSCQ